MNKDNPDAMHLDRRSFLAAGAAGVAALAARPSRAAGHEATPARVPGIQLYTVRDSMAEDPRATLEAIAAIGYREVEFAGYYDIPPAELKRLLASLGMTSPNSHVDWAMMRDDPRSVIEPAAELGNDYVTIAWLPEEERTPLDNWKSWADVLNRAGDIAKEFGMRAAYHNHEFEFEAQDGKLPHDVLLAETDPDLVAFELDFFWVRKAGKDIGGTLASAPQRFPMAHIKDMSESGEMVDVGAGEIDFAEILTSDAGSGLKHLFVEHDNPANSFRTAIIGHKALTSILT